MRIELSIRTAFTKAFNKLNELYLKIKFKKALYQGRFDIIKSLIDKGFDITPYIQDAFGEGKKCRICKDNHLLMLHMCFTINEDQQLYYQETLYHAIANNDISLVNSILNNSINYIGKKDRILYYACRSGKLKTVKYILSLGIIDFYKAKDEALADACLCGHIEIAKFLIDNGANVHTNQEEPLRRACLSGNKDLVEYLIKSGSNIHVTKIYRGVDIPLNNACKSGNIELVKLLIKKGIALKRKNCRALISAFESRNLKLIKYLISLGYDIKKDSAECLEAAVYNNDMKLISFLEKNGVSIKERGGLAFESACEYGNIRMFELLLKRGVDPKFNNGKGLIKAVYNSNFDIAQILIKMNAASEDWKEIVMKHACYYGLKDQIEFLVAQGINFEDYKQSAFTNACQSSNLYFLKYLISTGIKLNSEDREEILNCCYCGKAKVIKCIFDNIDSKMIDESLINECISTAVKMHKFEIIKYFLSIGRVKDFINEKTLNSFVENDFRDGILFLLENGVVPRKNLDKVVSSLSTIEDASKLEAIIYKYKLYDKQLINIGFKTAATYGYLKNMKLFIKLGAEIDVDNNKALTDACRSGHIDIVNCLIKNGINIYHNNGEAVNDAAGGGHIEIVKLLMDNGLNFPEIKNNVLQRAIVHRQHSMMKFIIEQGANVNHNDESILKQMCGHGNISMIKYLINKGAKIGLDLVHYDSFIYHACKSNKMKAVKLVIKYGAKLIDKNRTTLYSIDEKEQRNNEIINYMIEDDPSISVLINYIVELACKLSDISIFDILLSKGINKKFLMTLFLFHAISHKKIPMIESAIKSGADLHYRGDSILEWVCQNSSTDFVTYVLDKYYGFNSYRNFALEAACSITNPNFETIGFLINRGANFNKVKDKSLNVLNNISIYQTQNYVKSLSSK